MPPEFSCVPRSSSKASTVSRDSRAQRQSSRKQFQCCRSWRREWSAPASAFQRAPLPESFPARDDLSLTRPGSTIPPCHKTLRLDSFVQCGPGAAVACSQCSRGGFFLCHPCSPGLPSTGDFSPSSCCLAVFCLFLIGHRSKIRVTVIPLDTPPHTSLGIRCRPGSDVFR